MGLPAPLASNPTPTPTTVALAPLQILVKLQDLVNMMGSRTQEARCIMRQLKGIYEDTPSLDDIIDLGSSEERLAKHLENRPTFGTYRNSAHPDKGMSLRWDGETWKGLVRCTLHNGNLSIFCFSHRLDRELAHLQLTRARDAAQAIMDRQNRCMKLLTPAEVASLRAALKSMFGRPLVGAGPLVGDAGVAYKRDDDTAAAAGAAGAAGAQAAAQAAPVAAATKRAYCNRCEEDVDGVEADPEAEDEELGEDIYVCPGCGNIVFWG